MDASARLKSSGVVGHRIAAAFHYACGVAFDDANRFVEIMEVSRETSARLERAVAAAHFDAGHEILVEVIDEGCAWTGGGARRCMEASNPFFAWRSLRILRHPFCG